LRPHIPPCVEAGVEYGDLPKFLNFDFMANVAFANAAPADDLADAPSPPEAVYLAGGVTPNAFIRWTGAPDPEPAGWEIPWHETITARWTVLSFAKEKTAGRRFPGISTDDR
jgi:hypothetical protein